MSFMHVIESISDARDIIRNWRQENQRIALVPTMGNLHDGHLHLIKTAKKHADKVMASIFVNPMQFGPQEDFAKYPRTRAADQEKLIACGVDLLFIPTASTIYPIPLETHAKIQMPELFSILCGQSRPHFFYGVTTVVMKLLNILQPDVAVFGKKDYQQYLIIKKMIADFCLPIEIIGAPTERNETGLALSSRNQYLSATELSHANKLYQTLMRIKECLESGDTRFNDLINNGKQRLTNYGFKVDYLQIRHPETLNVAQESDKSFIILAAAFMGSTRLIDNIECSIK